MGYVLAMLMLTPLAALVPGVLWPWLGPQVLQPCPQFTTLGIWLWAGCWAFGVCFREWGKSMQKGSG